MTSTVEIPLWFFVLIVLFGAVTFASHFLFPSVRWFFRKRMERVVARLNTRLTRPIEPFKLARRYDMIQRLIYDPDVGRAIAKHAAEEGIPENVAFELAQRYAREIVPAFSVWTYFSVAARIAQWLSRAIYRVRVVNFDDAEIAGLDADATVVLVMNHRSNMDYVLLTYLAAPRGALSFAVGEWASGWPLGRIVRAMGAYFIRRTNGNDLYREVLAKYVHLATRAGVTQAVFPEGGLSLNGKLARPRLGILKYIVDAWEKDGRDVNFVTVSVNYDRIMEDRVLISADEAQERKFRTKPSRVLRGMLRMIGYGQAGRKERYGYAALSFGQPLALSDFDGNLRKLTREMMRNIRTDTPVLPVPLVARHMLEAEAPLTRAQLSERLHADLPLLEDANLYLPNDDVTDAIEHALTVLLDQEAVNETEDGFVLEETARPVLRFYAASIEHLFRKRSVIAQEVSASAGL
ncbi:MAG: 1-acyl-sn-glycerol-3-phosphate acyltransferase [Thalassovita sp.]